MRGLLFTASIVLLLASTSACSILVSTSGLSGGNDADGGDPPGAPSSGSPSAPGVALGDASPPSAAYASGSDAGPAPSGANGTGSGPTGAPDGGATTSDAGAETGASSPPDAGTVVDSAPPPPPTTCSQGIARVFLTSTMYTGALGGVTGADAACAARATAAGLGGQWSAWLSDSYTAAPTHIYAAPGGYVLLDGTVVASSPAALVSGSLAHAIDITELGAPISDGNTEVWTGIDPTGAMYNGGYCTDRSGNDWASQSQGAPTPLVGHSDATNTAWSAVYLQNCNRTNVRLYCFETCP